MHTSSLAMIFHQILGLIQERAEWIHFALDSWRDKTSFKKIRSRVIEVENKEHYSRSRLTGFIGEKK